MGGPHASKGAVVTRFVAFWKDPYRGWRLVFIGPLVALLLLAQEVLWAVSERIFGWRNH